MRAGQPFNMRYPLVEVEGSYGTIMATENWAQPRYTSSRLTKLADNMLKETTTDIVQEWTPTYDDTELMPVIFSSLGFYNIVNGSTGIAVGISSSIPQFNLKEVNSAMVKLLEDPDVSFDDIVCYPDFATGATIINRDEVKEALRTGYGKCIVRAKIDYDKKNHALVVKELPYGIYSNKICNKIESLVSKDENFGIININDLSAEKADLRIYLDKGVDPEEMKEKLYQKTSLQDTFKINMMMLEDGRFPRLFTWKEALSQHLEHEKRTYRNMYYNMREKRKARLSIVEGMLLAIAKVDEVIEVIKSASSTSAANKNLQKLLEVNEQQAKAILEIKLSRLAKMETKKYRDEKKTLESEIKELTAILESEDLLKKKMIERFDKVSKEFGDARRTEITQQEVRKLSEMPSVVKDVAVLYTDKGYIKKVLLSDYKPQKSDTLVYKGPDDEMMYLISSLGKAYRLKTSSLRFNDNGDKGQAFGALLKMEQNETINSVCTDAVEHDEMFVIVSSNNKIKAVNWKDVFGTMQMPSGMECYPEAETVVFSDVCSPDGFISIETDKNVCLQVRFDDIRPQGKKGTGVKAMRLRDGENIVNAWYSRKKDDKFFGNRGVCGKRI